jgi:hypothetical protein
MNQFIYLVPGFNLNRMKKLRNVALVTVMSALLSPLFGQTPIKKYEKQWATVQQLIEKSLPKSALTEVRNIYALAKREKQEVQIIKSLVYSSHLQNELVDDEGQLFIKNWEKELAASQEPSRSILSSLIASYYQQYYYNHRWEMYNRTPTTGFRKEDIATWGPEDFHHRIAELYLASIKNQTLLKQTRLDRFDAIIAKGNTRHLRPTLFDLLAHRALDYFENDERDLNKPSYVFEIDQASAFDPAADFVHRKYDTKDSGSLQHKALLIYQELISFHLGDQQSDALIDVDIKRIEFVRSKSVHPDKDDLYFKSINHVAHQYADLPAATQAWYLVAAYYNENASAYKPYQDSTHRLDKLKAIDICQRILAQKDSSEGKINCHNLLNTIKTKSLKFTMEKVNLPAQPFRIFVNYQNIPTVYLRVIRADEKLKKELTNQYDAKFWPAVISANPIKSWEQNVPAMADYQPHSAEVKIDALPVGEYMLVASSDKDFKNSSAILGARLFYISSISFVNNDNDYFVLNRDTGQPLAGASITIWEQKYDYTTSKYVKQPAGSYKTDGNGFFRKIRAKEDNNRNTRSYNIEVTHNNERLFIDDQQYDIYYQYPQSEPPSTNFVHLFIDRSLYRPGQLVYFKGIAITRDRLSGKSDILSGHETIVYLNDANGQRIDSQKVSTNDFGSFNGKFQLPSSGLTGNFSLVMAKDQGIASFNVEEYKRPKFYVEFLPLKGTYQVNDSIRITGMAKAYAGNNIDGAIIQYRVVRQARYLYPWVFRRWWLPPSAPMEIVHGEATTDKDGKFTIVFPATPDLKIDKKFDPIFDYAIYADVTDINGETRSGQQTVSVSYKSLIIKTDIPKILSIDSLRSFAIRTENLAGEFEPSTVKLTISKLRDENRLIRARFWDRPDQFIYSKEEYVRHFPFDEYDNETDWQSWEKSGVVLEQTDSTRVNGKWQLSDQWSNKTAGFYVVEIVTKDKNGNEVKDIQHVELYDPSSNRLSRPAYLWTEGSRMTEPGETARVRLGSSSNNVFVIQQIEKGAVEKNNVPSTYTFFKLDNERKTMAFPVTEADRGGYGVNWVFVKNNRFYLYADGIVVPWSNKNLAIEYASYRDKTLPGSEEKWKLRITGYKNEKVAAELLASMYDASLDQFHPHQWGKPDIWPSYYRTTNWNGTSNFSKVESQQKWDRINENYKSLLKVYDQLTADIYDFNTKLYSRLQGVAAGVRLQKSASVSVSANQEMRETAVAFDRDAAAPPAPEEVAATDSVAEYDGSFPFTTSASNPEQDPSVQIRKNFNETAFFFPDLRTDSSGAIEFSFTLPEALTRWKFQALTHTKNLSFGYSSKEIITQKQLMVQPNAPRFIRQGDKMSFSSKVVNLTENELKGQAELQLVDAATNQPVDGIFKHTTRSIPFTIAAGQSVPVQFELEVPQRFTSALTWRIVAKANSNGEAISDGEENTLPILTNRMLVTETLPLSIKGTGTRHFNFEKLSKSGNSSTLQHHALTVEFTSNPAWYAVQALPYLMEYPYDCAEQTWNRYFANSLAGFIANSSPRIKQIFDKWKISDTAALVSNLQKNQELKAVLLEETPWVLKAKTETEQKKNIALLFDLVRMNQELNGAFEKLKQMQSENGGFVWFKGGPDDRFITQYIVTGIGHLIKIKGINSGHQDKLNQILATAIPYLDRKIKQDYDELIKSKTNLKLYAPGHSEIQYLYMRSFFREHKIPAASQTAYNYFRGRVQQTWTTQTKYMQGMIALALGRTGDARTPAAILKSLKETSITHEEMGMYWKDARRGWWWHEAPIERQALLIEAFQEIGKDTQAVNNLRTWLLKNKQTNNWESTKATAEACYALLLQGTQWLTNEPEVTIQAGSVTFKSTDGSPEAGTGYFKKTIEGEKVNASMGTISLNVSSPSANKDSAHPGWGGVYWQYFEDLDKITPATTPLSLVKKLFTQTNSDRGPVLTPVTANAVLKVGDKVVVRIELRSDRDMEYVHMKDMRASCLEPVNVLSSYRWQNGLGYYESTRDASTNFFFDNLRKGTYVFEYSLFVTHTGNFSNGVTSIQCMYAPEFAAHSEGIRVLVK